MGKTLLLGRAREAATAEILLAEQAGVVNLEETLKTLRMQMRMEQCKRAAGPARDGYAFQ